MRRLTMITAAAAMLFGGMLMTTSANANAYDVNGAVKSGKMCLMITDGSRGFGYWAKCPKPAKKARHHKRKMKKMKM